MNLIIIGTGNYISNIGIPCDIDNIPLINTQVVSNGLRDTSILEDPHFPPIKSESLYGDVYEYLYEYLYIPRDSVEPLYKYHKYITKKPIKGNFKLYRVRRYPTGFI